MIDGGGIYISKEAAEELATVLELSLQLAEAMEAPKHIGEGCEEYEDYTEVRLYNALQCLYTLGANPDYIRHCLQKAEKHDRGTKAE